jgi:hypothetical protein
MHPSNDLNEFLNNLEFEVACQMELENINFRAMQDLTYKNPINLN